VNSLFLFKIYTMKFIVKTILLLFVIQFASAQQSKLEFNKKVYECENKWITYPLEGKDSSYILGYVYIDRDVGFSFHSEKKFKIVKGGKFVPQPKSSISKIISRIQNFDAICAVIPVEKFLELGITENPDFMKSIIKPDEAEDLLLRGSHYNRIGASLIALPILIKAHRKNTEIKGIIFELGYAYNAIGNYKDAMLYLQFGHAQLQVDWRLRKELIYSYVKECMMVDAEIHFEIMKKIKDIKQLDEAAYYIMEGYYFKNDAVKFEEWAKETMSHITSTNSPIIKNIDLMRKELKQ
jgi:hypothetical protein